MAARARGRRSACGLFAATVVFLANPLVPRQGCWVPAAETPRLFTRDAATQAAVVARGAADFEWAGQAMGDGGTSPLMLAAHRNDHEEVKDFVVAEADLNAQDDYGWTALRYAVRHGNAEAATALLEGGADANLASKSGRTPLMSAAGNGLSDMVELLIKSEADTGAKDGNGETALDRAMRGGEAGCKKCQKLLSKALGIDR